MDIWRKIYIQLLRSGEWPNFPNKASYASFLELQKSINYSKSCMKCTGKTILLPHNLEETYEISISLMETENELWYYCEQCKTHHNCCPFCNQYKKVSHMPLFKVKDKIEYKLITDDFNYTKFVKADDDGCEVEVEVELPTKWKMYFIDVSIWRATGPDGGFCHSWICEKCGRQGKYTDK